MPLVITTQKADRTANTPALWQLRDWCAFTLQQQKIRDAELCIRIVNLRESALLNRRYRHKSGPTNVLAFPVELPAQLIPPPLGDLVICAPVVNREAREQGKSRASHWAHMVVHGSLHLLGLDHQNGKEAAEMEAIETGILHKLGFADPYSEG